MREHVHECVVISPGRAGGRGSITRESLVLRMVVASQRSKAVLRVAERSDSIMLRSSSAVKDPATSHRTLRLATLQRCVAQPSNRSCTIPDGYDFPE